MLIMSRVCAEFRDEKGNKLFTITPALRGSFIDAPEVIRETLLFKMLIDDGAILTPASAAQRKVLENNPMAGANPDGSAIKSGTEGPQTIEEKLAVEIAEKHTRQAATKAT